MPHEKVGATLKRKLAPGRIVMTEVGANHAVLDHAKTDLPKVVAAIRAGFHRVEFVGREEIGGAGANTALYLPVPSSKEEWAVIPVSTHVDAYGDYRARSGFIAGQAEVDRRLEARGGQPPRIIRVPK